MNNDMSDGARLAGLGCAVVIALVVNLGGLALTVWVVVMVLRALGVLP